MNLPLDLYKTASEGVTFDPTRYNADQTAIQNFLNKLLSVANGDSGADNIAIAPIPGLGTVDTNTVYEMIAALKSYVETGFIATSNGYTQSQILSLLAAASIGQSPIYKTFVDDASLDGDIYTYGGLRREDNTLAIDFTLSNKVGGKYLTKTYKTYSNDGLTVLTTLVRTLTYKNNGSVVES